MADDAHQKALDLTDRALEELANKHGPEAQKLLDEAQAVDPTAIEEVVADMDEDAARADKLPHSATT